MNHIRRMMTGKGSWGGSLAVCREGLAKRVTVTVPFCAVPRVNPFKLTLMRAEAAAGALEG